MNCTICRKPIVLTPSAAERAAKYGDHPASYYTALFTVHASCQLAKRQNEISELIKRIAK